ncbi:MAG: endonuclease [Thermoplasmata archaeon]|nr:endonuclease [Thermoplasmata archaeon]
MVDDEDFEWLNQWRWYAHRNGKTFYAERTVCSDSKRICVKMHRVILNAPPDFECDHRNRRGFDNRRKNLRLCNHAENMRNKMSFHGISHFKGLTWQEGKWRVRIWFNGRKIHIGSFVSEIKAACAYDRRAVALFGEFARPNFPNSKEE